MGISETDVLNFLESAVSFFEWGLVCIAGATAIYFFISEMKKEKSSPDEEE